MRGSKQIVIKDHPIKSDIAEQNQPTGRVKTYEKTDIAKDKYILEKKGMTSNFHFLLLAVYLSFENTILLHV